MSPAVVILVALAVGVAVGLINALLVVRIGVDSFVTTLGMFTALSGIGYAITDSKIVIGVPDFYVKLSRAKLLGLPMITWYAWVLVVVLWFVYQRTPVGRYMLFIGGNRDAARLAGISVGRASAPSPSSGLGSARRHHRHHPGRQPRCHRSRHRQPVPAGAVRRDRSSARRRSPSAASTRSAPWSRSTCWSSVSPACSSPGAELLGQQRSSTACALMIAVSTGQAGRQAAGRREMSASPALEIRGLSRAFGGVPRCTRSTWQVPARRGARAGRSERMRQVHPDQVPRPGTTGPRPAGSRCSARNWTSRSSLPPSHGIAVIHQDLGLVHSMTVLENLGVSARYGATHSSAGAGQ